MLSRFISKPSRHLHLLGRSLSAQLHCPASHTAPTPSPLLSSLDCAIPYPLFNFRPFSTRNGDNNNGQQPRTTLWSLSSEDDDSNIFRKEDVDLGGGTAGGGEVKRDLKRPEEESSWVTENAGAESDVFEGFRDETQVKSGVVGADEWWAATTDKLKPWKLEEEKEEDVFKLDEIKDAAEKAAEDMTQMPEDAIQIVDVEKLKAEEEGLKDVLKGPNRAFGDLIAASGITDGMLDSLMALKNFEDIEGLPPLAEIEDMRYEKTTRKSSRHEMERLKQEEAAKGRVRIVDEKGRAYGTGKRKCSIARVWIEPGEGKFLVNDKEFDVYFPIIDHRAALLQPFSETKTLGLWDVKCTVKGGGVSGQVGAVRLGISRALQNWEPSLRPPLKEAGFLTRDPRVVERKKPGKAKARKSFQWVKR